MIQLLLFLIAFVVWLVGMPKPLRHPKPKPDNGQRLAGDVAAIVDGDTIKVNVNGQIETVRYIGINAPEIGQPGADRATEVNSRLVDGARVTLEFDKQRRDQYGRLLAYVWHRGRLINRELVRRNVAKVMRVAPNTKRIGEIES